MLALELSDAGFRYPDRKDWVFRHVDLSVLRGETVRIVGRNGTGKSTLLRVASGLLELSEGECRRPDGGAVSYMHQFSGEMLANDLTIAEQLRVAAQPRLKMGKASAEALAQFRLGLQHRQGSFIGHLSGGERQVVALLCTLAAGARILCLDEFTSALDVTSAGVADELLAHAQVTSNVALLIVSHSGVAVRVDREFCMTR